MEKFPVRGVAVPPLFLPKLLQFHTSDVLIGYGFHPTFIVSPIVVFFTTIYHTGLE